MAAEVATRGTATKLHALNGLSLKLKLCFGDFRGKRDRHGLQREQKQPQRLPDQEPLPRHRELPRGRHGPGPNQDVDTVRQRERLRPRRRALLDVPLSSESSPGSYTECPAVGAQESKAQAHIQT